MPAQTASEEAPTVVVVDDDPSICRALKTQLEILGFQVRVFRDAESLLELEVPSSNGCFLIDIYLPGMSGADLCLQLKQMNSNPIILMSGRHDVRTLKLMRESRPIAKLFKPFDQTSLLRAIRKALSGRLKPRG